MTKQIFFAVSHFYQNIYIHFRWKKKIRFFFIFNQEKRRILKQMNTLLCMAIILASNITENKRFVLNHSSYDWKWSKLFNNFVPNLMITEMVEFCKRICCILNLEILHLFKIEKKCVTIVDEIIQNTVIEIVQSVQSHECF